jgi:hypothetical protein
MAKNGSASIQNSSEWIQGKIETVMESFGKEERWEKIILLSSEGFPMASWGNSSAYSEENLLEFAFSLVDAVKLLSKEMPAKDVYIRGQERKILVFRYFDSWGEQLILSAVISGRKGYRRALGRLVKLIQSLG